MTHHTHHLHLYAAPFPGDLFGFFVQVYRLHVNETAVPLFYCKACCGIHLHAKFGGLICTNNPLCGPKRSETNSLTLNREV
jgi:hypothetical protein